MKLSQKLVIAFMAFQAFQGLNATETVLPLKLKNYWKVFLNVKPPTSFTSVPASLPGTDGGAVKPKMVTLTNDTVDLGKLKGSFQAGDVAVLYNAFHSDKAGVAKAGVSADYWMKVYVNGNVVVDTMGKGNGSSSYVPNDHPFNMPIVKGDNLIVAVVRSGSAGWRFVCGAPRALNQKPNVKFTASAEWRPLEVPKRIMIKEGSALDLRALTRLPKESTFLSSIGLEEPRWLPRLITGPTGKLAAINRPDVPVRLRSAGVNFPWVIGHYKDDWKTAFFEEARNAQRLGYNALRMYPSVGRTYKTPKGQDKADYFLYTLGKTGMYCVLDCFIDRTLRAGWQPGESRRDLQLRMFLGDKIVRDSWINGTRTIMNHVNPYTGLAWKDDPTIACMILYNEQEWGFFHAKSKFSRQTQIEFDVKFRQWLERKYNEPKALAKAWGDSSIKSFVQVETPKSFPSWSHSERDNDFVLFCGELARECALWTRENLRSMGYKGQIAQYNISQWLEGQSIRWQEVPVTIANAYHNHPSGFERVGSKCGQNSSIGAGIWYWRGVASTRFADRPYIQTEFNHSFWNPYQHECGAVFGAYSALQGFDVISIHGGAAFPTPRKPGQLSVFGVAGSPIARAGEFLAACLYLRGDVKTSPHRIEIQVPKKYIEKGCNGARGVSSAQGKLAFMTGFSVAFPWAKPVAGVGVPAPADLVIEPDGGSAFKSAGGGWAVQTLDGESAKFSLDEAVKGMKAKGVLPKDNLSDPEKGVYQSDTGEITMRTKENLLKIVTKRSEAVSLEAGKRKPLDQLTVISSSVPALVAACAVDDKNLAESERVVLVYSTYAVNTDMELSADRVTLVNLGKAPVLVQSGALTTTLKNANADSMKLYALALDGSRQEELPLKRDTNGALKIDLNTSALKHGPSVFFELVSESK